jgi:uncharacterized damage-inducible protein DinB
MGTTLTELFRHNLWANTRLLEACVGLAAEDLDASAPGAYGPVRDTVAHLARSEEIYVALLRGEQPEPRRGETEATANIKELLARARGSGEALIEASAMVPPTHVLRGVWRGEPYAVRAAVVLTQAINHATEHRSQVVGILSQRGISVPDLDGWAFGRETADQ